MAVEFSMPKLGLTMEEGTILEWLVPDGAEVTQGTPVLTIETDKVSSDVEAAGSGMLHITAQAGETVACGERIGWFLAPGETPPVDPDPPAAPSPAPRASSTVQPPQLASRSGAGAPIRTQVEGGRRFVSPNARRVAAWHDIDPSTVAGTGPNGRVVSEDVLDAVGDPRRPHATTAAHQAAARLGVDLTTIAPPGGRPIDRADVERHARTARSDAFDPPSATVPSSDEAPLLQTPSSTVPLTGMRGTIASRMSSSLRDMAQLTLTMDVVMDAVVDHRSAAPPPGRATITDYVVAAAAAALVEHPIVNSQINAGHVALLPEVHVGLAVALDGGLVVPVVKRTDTLDLPALSAETRRLVSAARDGTLTLAEIEGATFSVSTLGAYGVDAFTPVINPPNTAILGVGRLRDGVRWDGSRPLRTSLLTLSLTWDHRAFDGVPAAEFTATVRDRLQRWGQP